MLPWKALLTGAVLAALTGSTGSGCAPARSADEGPLSPAPPPTLASGLSAAEGPLSPAPPPTLASGLSAAEGPLSPAPPPTLASGLSAPPSVRDPRRGSLAARSRQRLVVETSQLERLWQATAAGSPDRARLLWRLAEGAAELEAVAARDGADRAASAARRAAIRYYTSIAREYPGQCPDGSPRPDCGGDGIYFLGYEHERAGDLDEARKAYLEILQRYPQSRFCAHVYFAFGEMFFREALGDASKWPLAEQSFGEAMKTPAPDAGIAAYARYELAHVYRNQGDAERARSQLAKVIEAAERGGFPGAPELAAASLRESAR